MRSEQSIDSATHHYRAQESMLLRPGNAASSALPHTSATPRLLETMSVTAPLDDADTGVEFLSVYRRLLAEIECWCKLERAPITQVIRWQALRDYVEVYSYTYPRQPSYPFPPRFGRYVAYLEGFDTIITAIDDWCEWLNRQFLPGVVPIHLLRSALEEWDETRRASGLSPLHAMPYRLPSMSAPTPDQAYRR
ncbi:MAG TPA: hypothetical protein VFZ66_11245 [Herpetosiphonaceae bacterium]